MWTRADIKEKGKLAFKANYWTCVLVTLVLVLIGGGSLSGGGSASVSNGAAQGGGLSGYLRALSLETGISVAAIISLIAGIIGLVALTATIVGIFIKNPLEMGCRAFFLDNTYQPSSIRMIINGFKRGYMRNVATLFLRSLFIGIASIFLFIPGIYLSQCFRLVPYILEDNPEMGTMDVLKESTRLMNGHKWAAFVLDLSFIGWLILSAITAGVLYVFYVGPYIYSTDAVLYRTISRR